MSATPLTPEQQTWLKTNAALPTFFLVAVLAVLSAMLACLAIGFWQVTAFKIFIALGGIIFIGLIGAAGKHIYNNVMDLRDGVAQVREGQLLRKVRSTSTRSTPSYYAEFKDLGTLVIDKELYEPLEEGRFYRITYSPRTRHGWQFYPLST